MLPPFWTEPEIAEFGAGDAIEQIKLIGVHELAALFDMLDGKDYDDLRDSIATQGLIDHITITQGGVLLDGRNRLRACLELNVPRTYRIWMGEPMKLVMAKNMVRRHLTIGQKAALATQLYEWHRSQPGYADPKSQMTLEQSAKRLGISRSSVMRARKLQRDEPETFDELRAGHRKKLPNPYEKSLPRPATGEVMLGLRLPLRAMESVRLAAEAEEMTIEQWCIECLTSGAEAAREMREALD